MDLREIIESGLLELYVLNRLSEKESAEVEGYIRQYPELSEEIRNIERGFAALGSSMGSQVSGNVRDDLMKKVRDSNSPTSGLSNGPWLWLTLVFGLATMVSTYLLYTGQSKAEALNERMAALKSECDSLTASQALQLEQYENFLDPENKILAFEATPKYPETRLYLHNNPADGANYIQVQDLPTLGPDQSFQLWSLKGDIAPQPLDVFEDGNNFFEVNYVQGSDAYAITIEQKGGAQSPNLDQLIGIVNVSG